MKKYMIKKLPFFLMLICLFAGVIQVQSAYAKDSDFKYRVQILNGGLESRDFKDVLHEYNGKDKVVKIPSRFRVIGELSFADNKTIETVIIPKSVTTIEESAFARCKRLKKVVFEKGSKLKKINTATFSSCKNLQKINLPNSVKVIGYGAFEKCEKLKKVVLPKKISKIDELAFHDCKNLQKINIPNSVKAIGADAFMDCKKLKEVVLPKNIKKINQGTFWGCENLRKINIPDGVEEIGNYAFEDCKKLKEVVLPKKIKRIGYSAFRDCINLQKINIPDGVKEIGNYAFEGCNKLIENEEDTLEEKQQQLEVDEDAENEEGKNSFDGVSNAAMEKAKSVISQIIKPGMSEYAKVQAVYEWMIQNIVYDEWYSLGNSIAGSPDGALLYGRAICSGYAETFQLFMDILGIQCKEVSGQAEGITYDVEKHEINYGWGPHAWNLVCINGNWYHVDATWDADKKYLYACDYFLLTDEELLRKQHKDWGEDLPKANRKADFWNEFIELRGNQIKKVSSVDEIHSDWDKCTEVGTYEFEYYSETTQWERSINSYIRNDVLFKNSRIRFGKRGTWYFFRYQFTVELKYSDVANTNPELVNFVQNEQDFFQKLDDMISSGEDLVFTHGNYGLCDKESFIKWADQRGYFTSHPLLNDNMTTEKVEYNTGYVYKTTIPRKCVQCSAQENFVDVDYANRTLNNKTVQVVNSPAEFEAIVAPLFEDPAASYAFSEFVLPMWDCSEEDILNMLNEIAVKHGYRSVELLFPLTKHRVSYSNYYYNIFSAGITLYRW